MTTHTIERPGATVPYDLLGDPRSGTPLLIFGSPMDASGFATLAAAFPERPVVTLDPRGTGRSTRTDTGEATPDEHAADLAAIVDALGGGPVDAFASSGGAVNALAWVTSRPEQVRRLVAHEPPLRQFLADREQITRVTDGIVAAYQERGFGPGMVRFIEVVMHQGPFTEEFTFTDADPAQFGMPTEDDGSRTDPLLGQNMRTCTSYSLDVDALRANADRLVLARGATSGDTWAARAADSVAEAAGCRHEVFPGDHTGFAGGELGMVGEPEAFAAKLREVLI